MNDRYQIGQRASVITLTVNTFLSLAKFTAGFLAGSTAMIADAIHSSSDVLTTLIVILSFKIAKKPEDEQHPYGHEKAESIAAKVLAIFLFAAGAAIGWEAIQVLLRGASKTPGIIALYAAALSIVSQESMYWYTIYIARKINSTALKADAWHHRSDALSSVGTFIGIGAARLGFPLADPLAAIIVALIILKVAFDIYMKSVQELMDTSAPSTMVTDIRNTILSVKKVKSIDSLKTRIHGNMIYADTEILVDNFISVSEGHDIAKNVEDVVKRQFDTIKDIMVHVNPCDPTMTEFCSHCPHGCDKVRA